MGSDGLNFETAKKKRRAFGSRARREKQKKNKLHTQQINYRLKKNREQVSETKKKLYKQTNKV